jgi:hypothetical protein
MAGAVEVAMVEYLLEAKRFIECARAAYSAEARDQDLDMAEWCIARAIEETGHKPSQQASVKSHKRTYRHASEWTSLSELAIGL